MKIIVAADHAGFLLKGQLVEHLRSLGHDVIDVGAFELDEADDYPDYCYRAVQELADDPDHERAILIGGSGQGEAMAANRFAHVRAALWNGTGGTAAARGIDPVVLSREHNNSNTLSLGARLLTYEEARDGVDRWLAAPFPKDERHVRRIEALGSRGDER